MESVFIGIVSGIISGLVASMIFALILYSIRPKVKISDKVSICRNNSETILRVKIVNLSRFMIMDADYTLEYCVTYPDGINDVKTINPRKQKLRYIKQYTYNKEDTDYAARISYLFEETDYNLEDGNKLIFTISGKHAFSNTSVCIRKEYCKNDLIEGVFESGKSTKIIRDQYQ